MSTVVRYICHAGDPYDPYDPYDRFAVEPWLAQQRAAGAAPEGPVTVRVEHPDREADGSCRWCGDTRGEELDFA